MYYNLEPLTQCCVVGTEHVCIVTATDAKRLSRVPTRQPQNPQQEKYRDLVPYIVSVLQVSHMHRVLSSTWGPFRPMIVSRKLLLRHSIAWSERVSEFVRLPGLRLDLGMWHSPLGVCAGSCTCGSWTPGQDPGGRAQNMSC